MPLNIIIAGAGIGGLTAAIALRQVGHNILLLEKQKDKRENGYAVTLPPNSTRVLLKLGIDLRKARATPYNGMDLCRADRDPPEFGPKIHVDPEKTFGSPHVATHRTDLWEVLFDLAMRKDLGNGSTIAYRPGEKVIQYDPSAGSVTLESGESLTADLVVAADGVRSEAHIAVLGYSRPATPSKLRSIRFVVPTKTLQENPKTAPLGFGETRARMYYGASNQRGIFQLPSRDNTVQNFGVIYNDRAHQVPSAKWITPATIPEALSILQEEEFHDSVLEIVRLADEKGMYLWKVADRDPLPKFTKGRLCLLGDACHPMRPDQAQGAAQAVEDAGVLGAVLRGGKRGDVEERLGIWEKLRKPRASAAQLFSRSKGFVFGIEEREEGMVRELLGEGCPELTRPAIHNWLWRYDCVKEAEKTLQQHLNTNRRSSKL